MKSILNNIYSIVLVPSATNYLPQITLKQTNSFTKRAPIHQKALSLRVTFNRLVRKNLIFPQCNFKLVDAYLNYTSNCKIEIHNFQISNLSSNVKFYFYNINYDMIGRQMMCFSDKIGILRVRLIETEHECVHQKTRSGSVFSGSGTPV